MYLTLCFSRQNIYLEVKYLCVRIKKNHDACKVQYVGTYLCTVYVYIPVSSYLYRCNIYMYVRYIAAGSLAVTKMVSSPFDSVPFHPQTDRENKRCCNSFTRDDEIYLTLEGPN